MFLSFVRVDRKTVRQLNSPWRTGRGSWKKLGSIRGKTTCLRFWIKIHMAWTSLVAQWIRTLLSTQGTWFDSCSRKTPHVKEQLKPMCHAYWSLPVPGLMSHHYRAHMVPTAEGAMPRAPAPQQGKPPLPSNGESLHTATKTQCNHKRKKDLCGQHKSLWVGWHTFSGHYQPPHI